MHLQLALVCEDARMRPDGKMDVEGIFNDLSATGFPARQDRMVLVLMLEWEAGDRGRIPFRVDLVGPDERPSVTVEGHTDVDIRGPGRPPARTRLILPLEGIVFPRPGRYTFLVRVKGRKLRGPSIFLMEAEEEGPPAGAAPGG